MYRFWLMALLAVIALPTTSSAKLAWSYDDDYTGQEDWGSLSKETAVCELGTEQSPVGINSTRFVERPLPEIHYSESPAKITPKDHTLVVDVGGVNAFIDANRTYQLTQIRFHTPSEHTVRGVFYPMEIQLIHHDTERKLLIVSIFAQMGEGKLTDQGTENAALQAILDHAPSVTDDSGELRLDPNLLLPKEHGYYAYTGSLTIPPCTQGVEWRIFKHPIQMSRPQFVAFAHLLGRNARLHQPIYMRTIYETVE